MLAGPAPPRGKMGRLVIVINHGLIFWMSEIYHPSSPLVIISDSWKIGTIVAVGI
jgi:hypothetical protein